MRTNRDDILIHPYRVVRLFDMSAQHIDLEKLLKDSKYTAIREAWIGSVFLLGVRKITEKTWWIRVNPIEAAAEDLFAASYEEIAKDKTEQKTLSIQVFTHRKTDQGNVFDGIVHKLRKRNIDLRNCILVCYLMKDELIQWQELNKELKKLSPDVAEVWVIGNVKKGKRTYGVFKVYPDVIPVSVDLDETHQTPEEKSFILPSRGLRKGELFERLKGSLLLKPDFSFEEFE